jgi:hypothetical protein
MREVRRSRAFDEYRKLGQRYAESCLSGVSGPHRFAAILRKQVALEN